MCQFHNTNDNSSVTVKVESVRTSMFAPLCEEDYAYYLDFFTEEEKLKIVTLSK